MTSSELQLSMFHSILYPQTTGMVNSVDLDLTLSKYMRFVPQVSAPIRESTLVMFDFETTGLDARSDRIIEVGAQKIIGNKVVDEIWSFIDPEVSISDTIVKLTGIDAEMIRGAPKIAEFLPKFLHFIDGSILIAHNAEFDLNFLYQACLLNNLELDWPAVCTVKLARQLLPQLESKNLDTLARHYELTFAARHRSIGDVEVLKQVFWNLIAEKNAQINTLEDLEGCRVYVRKS